MIHIVRYYYRQSISIVTMTISFSVLQFNQRSQFELIEFLTFLQARTLVFPHWKIDQTWRTLQGSFSIPLFGLSITNNCRIHLLSFDVDPEKDWIKKGKKRERKIWTLTIFLNFCWFSMLQWTKQILENSIDEFYLG